MKNLKNAKVAILGWGLDTSDAVPYLLKKGAKITVFDRKDRLDLGSFHDDDLELRLGKEAFGDLRGFDLIVRNPTVYRYRPEILQAEKAGVEISSKTKLFFDLCPAKIIGVTGTKGKGTTSTLIYRILAEEGISVFLGGNIGKGIFEFSDKLTSESWVVLELSSFQLIDLHKSPHVGVVLMITSDHLDWHESTEDYVRAKESIVKFQSALDFAIINADYKTSEAIGNLGQGGKLLFSTHSRKVPGSYINQDQIYYENEKKEMIINVKKIKLRGEHNLENVLAAVTATKAIGVGNEAISKAVSEFSGLEHRLEEVGVVRDVLFINDSFSTTPETAIAAIRSFSQPIILIAGGSEKGSDFTQLGESICSAGNVKEVILIGLMARRIEEAVVKAGKGNMPRITHGGKDMAEIVGMAYNSASPGDVVLLSPAAASFDLFKNYKQRGELFKEAVVNLKKLKK